MFESFLNLTSADLANVTTFNEASRSIGSAVGSAIGGAIWTHLHQHLPATAQPKAIAIQNSFNVAAQFPLAAQSDMLSTKATPM